MTELERISAGFQMVIPAGPRMRDVAEINMSCR